MSTFRIFLLGFFFAFGASLFALDFEAVYTTSSLEDVTVIFNESVDDTALNPANYVFDGGLTATAVTLLRERTVRVFTSPQTPHRTYSLRVSNVKNVNGTAIAPNTTRSIQ